MLLSKKIGSEYEKLSGKPFGNFIDVVRSRDKSKIEGPILEAHLSAALCHLGNISYRLGEVAPVASVKSAFGNDEIVQKAVSAVMKNTTDALPGLENPQWTLGPKLAFDPTKEQFVGNAKADALLTRDYRAPYIVPKNV